jgi:uncharacterized protein YkwD
MLAELVICASVALLSESGSTTPQPEAFKLHPIEQMVIDATNAQRAQYGLAPLAADRDLIKSARAHAIWMTQYNTMQHTSQPVAENIAMGQPDCASVMVSWMNSSGHRANILNPSYRRMGAAAYQMPGGTVFWCQQFMW